MTTDQPLADEAVSLTEGGNRKQNSRRKILDAAKELFVEHGYHDTRPQDISKAAGVGHGTFYLHFPNKRECFLAFVDEAQKGLDEVVALHTKDTHGMEARIRGVLRGVISYAEENPGVLTAATADPEVIGAGEDERKPLVQRWADDWITGLSADKKAGRIYEDYNPAILSYSIIGLIMAACLYAARASVDREEIVDNLTKFMVRGLSPAKD